MLIHCLCNCTWYIIHGASLSGVTNLRNTTNTNSTITVQWDPANASFCGGNILKYYVTISYNNGSLVDNGFTELRRFMFNDLMNNTNYVIAVLANNVAGNGAATTLIVTTSGPQGECVVCIDF